MGKLFPPFSLAIFLIHFAAFSQEMTRTKTTVITALPTPMRTELRILQFLLESTSTVQPLQLYCPKPLTNAAGPLWCILSSTGVHVLQEALTFQGSGVPGAMPNRLRQAILSPAGRGLLAAGPPWLAPSTAFWKLILNITKIKTATRHNWCFREEIWLELTLNLSITWDE